MRIFGILGLAWLVSVNWVVAACPTERAIRSFISPDASTISYVYGPTAQCPAGYCGPGATSLSPELTGFFWAVGFSHPSVGFGIDSGSLPPIAEAPYPYPSSAGILVYYSGYPAYFDTGWADPGVDGCIASLPIAERCTAIVLHDYDRDGCDPLAESCAALAVITKAEENGEYDLVQPGGANIELAPVPRVFEGYDPPDQLPIPTFSTSVPAPSEGTYLDPQCPDPIVGYKVYLDKTLPGALYADPDNFTEWQVAQGGAAPGGGPLPLGSSTELTFGCTFPEGQAFLGYTYVFENGTESPWVELLDAIPNESGQIFVPCCRDADSDGKCAPPSELQEDCDDNDPDVGPQFPQLCGDGVNNDCLDPGWPGLVGTGELDDDNDGLSACQGDCAPGDPNLTESPVIGGLRFEQNPGRLLWDSFGIQYAYDVYRGTLILGTGEPNCLASGVATNEYDVGDPQPGTGWFYLVSLDSTCEGLGFDGDGMARQFQPCP